MIRLSSEQFLPLMALLAQDGEGQRTVEGIALLVSFGVAPEEAPETYLAIRTAFGHGFNSVSAKTPPEEQQPPRDPTLADAWQAGRVAGELALRDRRQTRSFGLAVGLVALLLALVGAIVLYALD